MSLIDSAAQVNDLAAKEPTTGGLYFVTAFSGLLAPYWDPGAAGLMIGTHPPLYLHVRRFCRRYLSSVSC